MAVSVLASRFFLSVTFPTLLLASQDEAALAAGGPLSSFPVESMAESSS